MFKQASAKSKAILPGSLGGPQIWLSALSSWSYPLFPLWTLFSQSPWHDILESRLHLQFPYLLSQAFVEVVDLPLQWLLALACFLHYYDQCPRSVLPGYV